MIMVWFQLSSEEKKGEKKVENTMKREIANYLLNKHELLNCKFL